MAGDGAGTDGSPQAGADAGVAVAPPAADARCVTRHICARLDARPLGGTYNWEGPNSYPYAGISIYQPNATDAQFAELDAMIDDGDTSTGEFRQTPNGRYTYIVE